MPAVGRKLKLPIPLPFSVPQNTHQPNLTSHAVSELMHPHRRRRLPNLHRLPSASPLPVSHLHQCLILQLRRPTFTRQFISPPCIDFRISLYLYGCLLLVGGGFCCFLAFEEVDDAGGEGSEEREGADYAPGDCAGRGVVRGAGCGRDGGKRGAGACVWDGG